MEGDRENDRQANLQILRMLDMVSTLLAVNLAIICALGVVSIVSWRVPWTWFSISALAIVLAALPVLLKVGIDVLVRAYARQTRRHRFHERRYKPSSIVTSMIDTKKPPED